MNEDIQVRLYDKMWSNKKNKWINEINKSTTEVKQYMKFKLI